MGNLCGRKIVGYIDYENKKLKSNYFPNFILKCVDKKQNNKLYYENGIYFIVSNNFNINPLVQDFYFLKNNKIIKIDNFLNKYRNNIPLWIILKYENINPDNIFIKDFNEVIKILKVTKYLDKTLYEILT